MKIKKGLKLRKVGDTNIVVPVGEMASKFKGMIRLNASGSFLWKLLESDMDEAALVSAMLDKYDVDESTAKADVSAFLDMIRGADFLDE